MPDALKVKQMLEMVEPYAKVLRSVTVPSNVIIETLEYVREQEDLGKELTNAMELIHKKNKRIKDQQPKKGHWETKIIRGDKAMCCSVCGGDSGTIYDYPFCPNCGADMRKDGEQDDR